MINVIMLTVGAPKSFILIWGSLNVGFIKGRQDTWKALWGQQHCLIQWNSTFFCIFIYYRGHHRQGVAIFNVDYDDFQPKLQFQ
jgi:hypothetical protein